ncbi:MAG TPA: SDR family NAD(P)-dependent oxidoreductase, partial [Phycisphaerae bacterium]|nr:SDR family NAD(P)-dependent oxidoreductase [Phycisphaerae bacterium]
MTKSKATQNCSPERFAEVIPIVRGLLADPTGDEDKPYNPIILKSITSPQAIDYASSPANAETGQLPSPLTQGPNPPLFADIADCAGEPENVTERLKTALADYTRRHGEKPRILCFAGMGILYVEEGNDSPGGALKNKVALVTGAAGAIGYAVCKGLLANGCYLAATDLPGEKLDVLAAELKQTAGDHRVIGVPIDVTDKDSVARGCESIIHAWGGIDIAVINAGIALVSHLKDMDIDAFRRLEKVNVEGALLTLSELARHFILQGIGGDIIVMSTKNVPSPGAGFGAYSATKAAAHQLGRIASLELAMYGVRVNMVAPDAVFSEGGRKSGLWEEVGPGRMKARGLDEDGLHEYYRNRNLLKTKVTGRHVANAVLFFA